ncbi:MAG: glycosyltransferase [Cyanobacteriota bacterium]|nr:glycosyltransferase [Cyanobacteriota bacterium]
MSLDQPKVSYIRQLRDLQSRGLTIELITLINVLKKVGYPESILRAFEAQPSQNTAYHPYHYEWSQPTRYLGPIVCSPLVSVIIVVYHSGEYLARLLETLQRQSYTNLELIVVNNGGGSLEDILSSWKGEYHYLTAANPGFAEGNNIGLEKATGDLLLLLNPDAELQVESIKELVHALEIDASAAAAIPLIYFSKPFYKISFSSKSQVYFAINLGPLLGQLHYKKFFIRDGEMREDGLIYCNMGKYISLDIALNTDSDFLEIEVISLANYGQALCLQIQFEGSGEKSNLSYITTEKQTIALLLSKRIHSSSRYLINNAGSALRPGSFEPYDIGFAEVDVGTYASRAYRQALCGCCALLRRELFIKRKLFISEFFAYYEDSELSYWLTSNHMNILYVPSAIIYHRHSESTVEHSPLWNQLVSRSAKIYDSVRSVASGKSLELSAGAPDYSTITASQDLIRTLKRYDANLVAKNLEELISRTSRTTVGIYNSFWASMGGGERHALDVAEMALTAGCEVYLIAESHFSLSQLRQFFQVSLIGVKKLVVGEMTESLTQRFDIFINSTFCSSLISYSALSYYLVSFPHKNIDRKFISSYEFLYNSEYTRRWAIRYWGEHRGKLLLPILSFEAQRRSINVPHYARELARAKEFVILSVGRFNYDGHCKNQHIIAQIFAALWKAGAIRKQWQLVLVGSIDASMHASISHFKETEKCLVGCNARLVANAEMAQVKQLYQTASIYIHAAGLGVDPISAPEKNEHFGIAPFESLLHGCLLMAFHHGGPAGMVDKNRGSHIYRDQEELKEKILQVVSYYEQESLEKRRVRIESNLEYSHGLIEQSATTAFSLFSASNLL